MQVNKPYSQQVISELYEKADAIVPLAEKDGEIWVSFDDASVLNSLNALDKNSTGMQTRNRDGSLASTGKRVHAVNPDYFFLNRYKKQGKKMLVVSGHEPTAYRCIREQTSGRCFVKNIPCYIISRDSDGKLYCEARTNITEKQFIEEFNGVLNNSLMAEILPLITERGNDLTAVDKMPI